MELTEKGAALIKGFESCKLTAYRDAKGVPTIGWGNTFYEDKKPVKMGQVITQARADELFKNIVVGFVRDVNILTQGVALQPHQFDALVSFAYNVGADMNKNGIAEGLGDSTLLKKVKANPNDFEGITAEFLKWNKSGGKVLPGLIRRRRAEAHLYTTGEVDFFN